MCNPLLAQSRRARFAIAGGGAEVYEGRDEEEKGGGDSAVLEVRWERKDRGK